MSPVKVLSKNPCRWGVPETWTVAEMQSGERGAITAPVKEKTAGFTETNTLN